MEIRSILKAERLPAQAQNRNFDPAGGTDEKAVCINRYRGGPSCASGARRLEATPPDLQQRILKMMLATPDAVAADTLIAIQHPSQWTNEPVKVPVLAVNCAKLRSDGWERAIKVIYPMAEFHRIPDTGHFLMMEAPEAFNRLVEGFLARMKF